MRTAKDLPREALERIVDSVQKALWQDQDGDWRPDLEWNPNTLDEIAYAMTESGLKPPDEPE